MGLLNPPQPLGSHHHISRFASGTPSIDSWLRSHAHINEAKGASRTYVISDLTNHIIGFYSIAANAVETTRLPSRMSRNIGTTKILGVKRRPFRFPDLCLPHWRARASVIRTSYKSYSRAPTAA